MILKLAPGRYCYRIYEYNKHIIQRLQRIQLIPEIMLRRAAIHDFFEFCRDEFSSYKPQDMKL
jgi:hypothetical protein